MKQKEVENGSSEVKTHTAAPAQSLAGKKKFSWLVALPVMVAVAIVGIFIVFNTFAATASESYVRDLYTGLLGRTPATTDSGVKYWATRIDNGKSTKAAVYTAIYNSSEAKSYRDKLIKSGNYSVPGATPTTPAQQAKQGASDSRKPVTGTATTAQVAAQTAWVKSAYKEVFGREIDKTGLAFWVDQLTKRGKSQADVRKVFNDKKTADDAKSAKSSKPTAKLTAKQCRAQLLKDGGYSPGLDSYFTNKTIAQGIVRDSYYSNTGKEGWELTSEMVKQVELIENCQKTRKQLAAELKASPAGQAHTSKEKDFVENVKGPINDAYMEIFVAAWEAKGRKFTVVPFQLSQQGVEYCTNFMNSYKPGSGKLIAHYCFRNVGLNDLGGNGAMNEYWESQVRTGQVDIGGAVAAISSKSAGICPRNVDGNDAAVEEIFPSCAGGGQFISQEDLSSAQAQLEAKKQAQKQMPQTVKPDSPLKPASGTNSISY